ncbi:MAG: DNA primase [Chitinophagia bacterium]|jgi:DNA primase|nr:DNA primase [Chitinophagia bacterium]NDD15862.1 DNA primase [Chitinophagia bacterium]
MITSNTIQQITNRIDIIDVVGEFVKLKKRGTNYIGNCPFHNEKSPSFTVSPAKEIYKCFGCGKSGNTITFLMEHEKYSYVESLRWLAARYNIEIEETESSPAQKLAQQVADSLYAINNFAMDFFTKQYWETEAGESIAQSYMQHRGFLKPIIEKFKIGYNPSDKDSLAKALIQNQFNPELFAKTGLVVERNGEWQDNYRDRIIFPIHNTTGKIIGFGARQIAKNDKSPKYINSPENDIYVKSKILYGSYFARNSIDKLNECLLVEGYTDVVSLHQAGIENVVASGGTSLTIEQLRLIKKYTQNLTIIYDGDAAGVKAALRGLDMALEEGLNVQLVLIPDNEDPDSYVNKVGPDAFREFVRSAKKDFVLFQLEVQLKEVGGDLNKKNALVNQIAETLSKINKPEDFTKLQEYVRKCASLLRIDETGLTQLVNKFKRDKIVKEEKKMSYDEAAILMPSFPQGQEQQQDTDLFTDKDLAHEKNLVKLIIDYGNEFTKENKFIADWIFDEIESFPLENEDMIYLVEAYKKWFYAGKQPNAKTLQYHEDEKVQKWVVSLFEPDHELSSRWNEKLGKPEREEVKNIINEIEIGLMYFKLRKVKKMISQNQMDLETAPEKEQIQLLQIHKHLKEVERALTQGIGTVIMK